MAGVDFSASVAARFVLLVFFFRPKILRFERFVLVDSSVAVAPVSGGELLSAFGWDDILDGTFSNPPFFCGFSGTAGPVSFVSSAGADDPPSGDFEVDSGGLSGFAAVSARVSNVLERRNLDSPGEDEETTGGVS